MRKFPSIDHNIRRFGLRGVSLVFMCCEKNIDIWGLSGFYHLGNALDVSALSPNHLRRWRVSTRVFINVSQVIGTNGKLRNPQTSGFFSTHLNHQNHVLFEKAMEYALLLVTLIGLQKIQ